MKKLIYILLISLVACKKNTNEPDIIFTETKNNIQLNEPVLLSFGDNSSTESTSFSVEPNSDFVVNHIGDYATFSFNKQGNYVVTATKSSNKKAIFKISVVNTLFNEFGNNFALESPLFAEINKPVTLVAHATNRSLTSSDWNIRSVPSTYISNSNNSYTLSFQNTGAKYITVSDGLNNQTKVVYVTDATNYSNLKSLIFSDKLSITPSLKNGMIYFASHTQYNYNCSADDMVVDAFSYVENGKNNYLLSFCGLASTNCIAKGKINNNTFFANTVPNGTFNFFVNYENKTFKGTITNNNGNYIIDFVNNSLVEFTTKTF